MKMFENAITQKCTKNKLFKDKDKDLIFGTQ